MREKTNNLGFRTGPTQTRLYKHRRWLETGIFVFRKKRNCTIHVAKTKALISFAVTAKLICVFVFAYADCWFSYAVAQISCNTGFRPWLADFSLAKWKILHKIVIHLQFICKAGRAYFQYASSQWKH